MQPLPFTYTISNGQITITGYTGLDSALSIPASIYGLPVAGIGDSAFSGCTSLTSVTITSSVTSIGNSAFSACSSLTLANFLGNAPVMGTGVFAAASHGFTLFYFNNATGFTSPTWNDSSGDSYPANNFTYTVANGQITITGYNGSSNSVNIPSSINGIPVTSLGNNAFSGCTQLTNATIPFNVTSIGTSAFFGCTGLTSFSIPSTVTSIGASAFSGCIGLTTVTIPISVTSIGSTAFFNCTSLNRVYFLGNAPSLGSLAFASMGSCFTFYYFNNSTGFTSPTWNSYPSVNMGNYSPLKSWLLINGMALNTDLLSTPNNDQVPLLMNYALNLDPCQNQSTSLPQPVISGSQMSLTYYAATPGITYTAQASNDLVSWSSEGVTTSSPDASGFCTATIPLNGSNRFMRLQITY